MLYSIVYVDIGKNGIYFEFHQFFYFIWFSQDFRVSYDAFELNKDKYTWEEL